MKPPRPARPAEMLIAGYLLQKGLGEDLTAHLMTYIKSEYETVMLDHFPPLYLYRGYVINVSGHRCHRDCYVFELVSLEVQERFCDAGYSCEECEAGMPCETNYYAVCRNTVDTEPDPDPEIERHVYTFNIMSDYLSEYRECEELERYRACIDEDRLKDTQHDPTPWEELSDWRKAWYSG